jgi:putative flippase GtrA
LFKGLARHLSAFAVIGALCTLAWLVLYLLFRMVMPSLAANALSLVITTVANTAANRRFTFGVTGSEGALRHQLEGGVVFLIGLALSSGGLGLVHWLAPTAPRAVEITAMLGSYALATLVRFVLLGGWVFHPRRGAAAGEAGDLEPVEIPESTPPPTRVG